MKKPTNLLASISLVSLSVTGLSFGPATAITSPISKNHQSARTLLIAQGTSCHVINLQRGQLALRFAPNGKSRAGLDNWDTVEVLRNGSGWSYVRVINGPNRQVNGLEGWVNSNYLSCSGVTQSKNFTNVIVFDPPSKVRTSPNGNVLCTISNQRVIQVYSEPQGSWYRTSACGGGWIHDSQFRSIR